MFRAKVKPTQKDKTYCCKKFYQLWFTIKKSTGDVTSAYCTCIGGLVQSIKCKLYNSMYVHVLDQTNQLISCNEQLIFSDIL